MKRKRKIRKLATPVAAELIGGVTKGMSMFALTKGLCNLIDIFTHLLEATGPADVVISVWTLGADDVEYMRRLQDIGKVKRVRWVLDVSFVHRCPQYLVQLDNMFGLDDVRFTENHAKILLIENEDWAITVRTSMNLNKNPRFEWVEIDDCEEMTGELTKWVDDMWEKEPAGARVRKAARKTFKQLELDDGVGDAKSKDAGIVWAAEWSWPR